MILGVVLAGLMMNGFALIVGGRAYTAWSIRARNRMYYALLRREVNRQRAEEADRIAEDVVRWLRPLLLVLANALWITLAFKTLRGG
ncbi:hypothetical protein EON79_15340 [bacterium]|nr:MAG: hypothetical protein EON79_15340 [bacterium]